MSQLPSSLNTTANLRDALATIERSVAKIAIVVDTEGRLARTVTDGDIRRGLLAGLNLASQVADLPGREPVWARRDLPLHRLLALLDDHGVSAVVCVDDQDRPVNIFDRATAVGTTWMSPPHIGAREIELVHAAFDDNWVAPAGPNLEAFEHKLREISGQSAALAVASGTAALHLALRALGIGAGKRVYVSDLTFVASLQPILYEQAIPVLIDSEPIGWNMSPQALQRRLAIDEAAGILPSAIVVVHIYGQSAHMEEISEIAKRYGVPVIEDAAESLGATYKGRPSGSHGLLAAYSFNGNKIVTTSGGGALVSNNGYLVRRARHLATQGRDPAEHYQHSEVAYNYRMSNVLAGIGVGQLELLQQRVSARRRVFQRYRDALGDIPGVSFQEEPSDSVGNRWLTVLRFDPNHIHLHPYQIMRRMRETGIETRPGWKPMHLQPLCATFPFTPHDEQGSVSSMLFFQSLCLPSGSSLEEAEQDRITQILRTIIEEN